MVCTGAGFVPSALRGFGCGVLLTDTLSPAPRVSCSSGADRAVLGAAPCPPCSERPSGRSGPSAVPELHLVPAAAGRGIPRIPRGPRPRTRLPAPARALAGRGERKFRQIPQRRPVFQLGLANYLSSYFFYCYEGELKCPLSFSAFN